LNLPSEGRGLPCCTTLLLGPVQRHLRSARAACWTPWMKRLEMPRNREHSFLRGPAAARFGWRTTSPSRNGRGEPHSQRPGHRRRPRFRGPCPRPGMFEDAVKTVGAEARLRWLIWENWCSKPFRSRVRENAPNNEVDRREGGFTHPTGDFIMAEKIAFTCATAAATSPHDRPWKRSPAGPARASRTW